MKEFKNYTGRTGNVLSKQLRLLWRYAMVLLAVFAFSVNAFAQNDDVSKLPPTDRCTSEDLQVIGARLDLPKCYECTSETITTKIELTIHNTTGSTRTTYLGAGTLYVNGVASGGIVICDSPEDGFTGGSVTKIYSDNITIPCGATLEIKPFYGAWTDASDTDKNSCAYLESNLDKITPKCDVVPTLTITTPLALSATTTNVNCFGESTGAINLSVAGGTGPYTYAWTASAGGVIPAGQNDDQDLSGLVAGTYSVIVTDAEGCTKSLSRTITQPSAALALSANVTNVNCYGGSTGAINLTVTGGTAPYTYDWSNDGLENPDNDPQDLSGLAAGTYTVTVTDANGCVKTMSWSVNQPTAALALSAVVTNVSCFGGNNGAINVTATGGTAPYSYNWSDITATPEPEDRTGLTVGTYSLTVTDAKGCTATMSWTVTQPAAALGLSASVTNVACYGGSTGAINLSVAGGTSPYTYDWSNDGLENPDNDPQDLSGLVAGTYTVIVTDANGCTATLSRTVKQPAALAITASGIAPTCANLSGGSISGTITGGTKPYSVSINNFSTSVSSTGTFSFIGLPAGVYTIMVRDANYSIANGAGCATTFGPITLAAPVCNLEGCTPGYWKQSQHFGNWGCGYVPTGTNATLFSTALGLTSAQMTLRGLPTNLTLLQALSLNGGGFNALARHAAAALLNACSGVDVDYKYTTAQIKTMVQAAFTSGNPTTAHNNLAAANEMGCPLGRATLSSSTVSNVQAVEADRISAYPTPFSDKATIEFTVSKTGNYVVNLYDMKGALVKQLKAGTAKAGELQLVEVDGKGLGEGLYIARMISDSGAAKSVKLLLKRD